MNQRRLGRTALEVSEIGFGCGSVGGLMVRGDRAEQERAVHRALELGVSYFDTAPSYGDGRSEENLGRVLRGLSTPIYVGTKFRLDPEELDNARAAIRSSLEASLRRLGRDRVELFQLHSRVTMERGVSPGSLGADDVLGPVLAGLRDVQSAGLARYIGITGLGDTEALHQVIASGEFDTVQCYFNVLNPSAGYSVGADFPYQDFRLLIDAAAEHGVGVLVIRSLAAGALSANRERPDVAGTPGNAFSTGSDYEADLRQAQTLQPFLQELGLENTLELAVRFALGKQHVSTVLVGVSNSGQLEELGRWAGRGGLDGGVLSKVLSRVRDAST